MAEVACDKIAQIDMALSAGTRLGPYEILAPIGAGGMGGQRRDKPARSSEWKSRTEKA